MKVDELKAELEARDEVKTGNKAWLRRRLHAAIVREHLESIGTTGRQEGRVGLGTGGLLLTLLTF